MPIPLIRTKLHRPPVDTLHLHRLHLLARLNKRLHRPLTLISAPAGYGKSTLVSCWLEASKLRSAWLSIDEADNDLHLFLAYFLAAVHTVFPGFGQKFQTLLKNQELPPLPILAGHLINELDTIDEDFILALDDYHVVQNVAIHELLEEILKHPPHAMHLVLASRIDPPLPLTSLRAKGQMTEIRVKDLRFSRKETAEFLQQMLERSIEERAISIFFEKTEGWITGLRLAALSLRHTDDVARVAAGLPDANRYVLDYFVEEILSQQSSTIQDYLLATSILNRFCAPLCDAVCMSDRALGACEISGQQFIQVLIKTNLFVIPMDDEHRWFRYHHLFQNLLDRRLKHRFKQEDIKVLHTKASIWFDENGYFEEAIQHALAGGEVARAADIVGHARHDLMNRDQWHRLERWLKLFAHEAAQHYPHLILVRCWLDLYHWYRLDSLVNDLDQADRQIETASLNEHEAGPLKAEVAAMRSNLAYWTLNPTQGVVQAKQVLRDSLDGYECVLSTAISGYGALYQMLGEVKQAERVLWDHMDDGRFNSQSSLARLMFAMCIVYWPEADTRKLLHAATDLRDISLRYDQSWSLSFAHYFIGLYYYERNELTDAAAQFEIVVKDPYRFPIQNITHCAFLLSLSHQALGAPDKAREIADAIAKLTFERGNRMFIDLAGAFQADLDLRQGRIAQADRWARAFVPPAPHGLQRFFNAELTFIRIMLTRNTPRSLESAAEQLDSMNKLLVQIHHRRLLIDVMGMQALLADAMGQESTAFEKLSEALILAEPGVFIRPFLDLGHKMGALLKRLANQSPDLKYTKRILAAFRNEVTETGQKLSDEQSSHRLFSQNQTLLEPLTDREMEILLILSKRLSNHEIAERLFISVETVKRHLSNIYQKLDVKTRKQALVKAKSMELL